LKFIIHKQQPQVKTSHKTQHQQLKQNKNTLINIDKNYKLIHRVFREGERKVKTRDIKAANAQGAEKRKRKTVGVNKNPGFVVSFGCCGLG